MPEETKVGGRQRPSKHRRLRQRGTTVVRIVGLDDVEFRVLRHGEADADQAFRQQLAEARRRVASVDTSAPSQFDPSLVRNTGSRPAVSSNR